jgi:hypothetical protein
MVRCVFSPSLLKVKEEKQQHNTKNLCGMMSEEDFYIFGFDEGAGRRKKDWARQLQLQLSLLLLLFLLLLF